MTNTMISPEQEQLLESYNAALALYKQRRFKEAKAGFEKCLEFVPDDGPAKLYIERCETYIQHPPADDWDGVFVMKTK